MNSQFFDDLASKITRTMPSAPTAMKQEIEQSVRNVLRNAFDKMDLVTREDFEVQSAVLQKTRIKLELLEKKLSDLESKLDIN
ncbi:accessory factor UbiK family protein [sulfur-oxidizing endosymbiont of Gigantopelta aegis]|uniref:accessory factor UbiK family protein n=1 Tax=sulfur-oxidizing endosymbiont of Gigantopelta aegis TaxID=2794934 RepID=UPI0018DDFD88|nr:accessory factor UbiK family protein [sulfur-oxidizing endosymbiont of Gigantopelta aegis]